MNELPAAPREGLIRLLAEKSYEARRVILSSGAESDYYLDGRQTSLHPEGLYIAGSLMYEAVRASAPRVVGVGGPTLGADPLVAAVALISHLRGDALPAFIVRKQAKGHGAGNWLEGARNLEPGGAVALVEDTVTTGGSLLKAAQRVREAGYSIARVVSLVDREEGGADAIRAAGLDYQPIVTISEVRDALD